jgi:hypothetical protein
MYVCIYSFIHPSNHPSIYPFIQPTNHPSIHLSIQSSIYLLAYIYYELNKDILAH